MKGIYIMKMHIGIITAEKSMNGFMPADEYMKQICDITYLPYATSAELVNVYLDNVNKFDGILFSGEFPYVYITENVCRITKPCRYLCIKEIDIYLTIAKLFANNPNIDFTHVSFDSATIKETGSDISPIMREIFSADKMPYLNYELDTAVYNSVVYDTVMNVYRDIWKSKKAELIVTQLTNIADRLKSENIPYYLLRPSKITVIEIFNQLISDIKSARYENSLAACCTVQIAHNNPSEEEYDALEKALNDFNSRQNMCFVIRRNGEFFDLVTSSANARELTNNYISCMITSFLLESVSFHTYIGWGIDLDIVTAHQKAVYAIRESNRDPHRYTYMVNENDEVVGPFGGDRTIVYQMNPGKRISNIAKNLGISAINLEKLVSLQKNKNITEFTAADLVFYLDITPRSATRILKKLSEHGAATKVNSMQLNSRGRPSAIYTINLDNIIL